MNNKLFDLMTAEPVSTATNAHEQMDRLILENDMAQTNMEDMMYGAIRSSENFIPYTGGVSQEDLFSMVTGGGAPMVGGMARALNPGGKSMIEILKQLSKGRRGAIEAGERTKKSMLNMDKKLKEHLQWQIDNPLPFPGRSSKIFTQGQRELDALKAIINKAGVESMNYRDLGRAMEQYKRLGYANPLSIQKLKK